MTSTPGVMVSLSNHDGRRSVCCVMVSLSNHDRASRAIFATLSETLKMLRSHILTAVVGITVLAGCGANAVVSNAPTQSGAYAMSGAKTFKYTAGEQSFTVPSGVKFIDVIALGASAAREPGCNVKGRGARVHARIPVTPGERLHVFVGGESGFNGGGGGQHGLPGGGASDVREGGNAPADRIVVAGGGGAAGLSPRGEDEIACGGGGGGTVGDPGERDPYSSSYAAGGGGAGGSQSRGGAGGAGGQGIGSSYPGSPGKPGKFRGGGAGGSGGCIYQNCICAYADGCPGGGGGGGYYGGGGGGGGGAAYASIDGAGGGGGGGGSSYAESRASQVHFWQNWRDATGNGLVVLSW